MFVLTLDGDDISPPVADLVSLRTQYNAPRELVFTLPDWADVSLNTPVVLTVDGVVRFRGTSISAAYDPELGSRQVITAHDLSERAEAVQILRWKWALAVGELWSMFYGRYTAPLSDLLTQIAAAAIDELEALGVCDTTVFSGVTAGTVPAMDLYPASFPQMLDRILEPVSGVKWLYVPAPDPVDVGGTFQLVNVLSATPLSIAMPGTLQSLGLMRSIEGRFSRVAIEPIVYSTAGSDQFVLTPAWDSGLEASWSMGAVGVPGSALSDVFRKYSYAGLPHRIVPDAGMQLLQVVPRWPSDAVGELIPIEIDRIDPANELIWTKNPTINFYTRRRTAATCWVVGQSKPAMAVKLLYQYADEHIATEATAGPDGTAYSRYGLDRTLRVQVDSVADVNGTRAQQILDLVKDELFSGSLPLAGEVPPAALWDLGVVLNITGGESDLESMGAIVTGYTHEFGDGGRTTIELTTDKSAFARGVMRA